ncbi:hypothetical protein B296_00002728 [Ensete ventricosum]|uniref:Uncharacterized protein n=1 Tax=Ensete ventricosum TaxID=4639 RepID=A0A427AUD2_ENSVE|nr:hypothetical protein B296_00002728 [Ensete ventricosum]
MWPTYDQLVYAGLTVDRSRKRPEERSGATTSPDHGGDPAHTGNLIRVIHHPTLRDDPNILPFWFVPSVYYASLNRLNSRQDMERRGWRQIPLRLIESLRKSALK